MQGIVESNGPRAQAANRTRRDFEHVDALRVHSTLGVDGPVPETQRPRGGGDLVEDGLLHGVRGTRRRHVDRLFEERTNERIGFVEDDEGCEDAGRHHTFYRELVARDVGLDEDAAMCLVALAHDIW